MLCDLGSSGHGYGIADAEDMMSVTSNSAARPASLIGLPEGVGFWIVVALILVAIVAGAFLGHVPDGVAQAPYVGP